MLTSLPTRTRTHNDTGFTLIELLVVVLVIGILAAIAIPVFVGQQNQAKDAAAKSDIGNAKQALAAFFTTDGFSYSTLQEEFTSYGLVVSDGTSGLEIHPGPGDELCFQETSASEAIFHANDKGGVESGACESNIVLWAYDYDE